MFIDDTPGISLTEMRAKARRLRQMKGRSGPDRRGLPAIDVGALLAPAPSDLKTVRKRCRPISRGLKALAKEMRVPVIALSQLSRASRAARRRQKAACSPTCASRARSNRTRTWSRSSIARVLQQDENGEADPDKKQGRDHHRQTKKRPDGLGAPRLHGRLHAIRKSVARLAGGTVLGAPNLL